MSGGTYKLSRRRALELGLGLSASAALGFHGRARAEARAETRAEVPARTRHLVCIELEGGADGLSLLPPLGDASYGALRKRTYVHAKLALDARVGLHPALEPLIALYARGELLALTGVGPQAGARVGSHLAAQRAFEASIAQGLAPALLDALEPHASQAHGSEAQSQSAKLASVLDALGTSIRAGTAPRAVLLRVPGFDTHLAQGKRLTQAFGELGDALSGFVEQLGARYADTVVLVATERGRSLRENRTAGTEDGDGAAALLFGGAVAGGRVLAPWPRLSELARAGRNALPVTLELSRLVAELHEGLWDVSARDRGGDGGDRGGDRDREHGDALGLLRAGGFDAC